MFLALIPLVALFLIGGVASSRLPHATQVWILSSTVMTLLGLMLFLTGANGGSTDMDRLIGSQLAKHGHSVVLLGVAFALGFLAVLVEPAVYMLIEQIQDTALDSVRRTTVMGAMALDVGLAVMPLTLYLVVVGLELWHLLTAGYILTLGLTPLSSELFGRFVFDGGGVAPGPMVITFVLAFVQGGAVGSPGADPVVDGLGLVSMVALMPLVATQLLGILFSVQTRVRTNLRRPREVPHESDAPDKSGSQGNPGNQGNQNKPNPSAPEGE